MDTNVIVVKQLPVIEEQLIGIKREIETVTQEALAMECNDATVKEVKARRAELNKQYKEFEEKRKDVKKSILAPYEYFETVYKNCISIPFSSADKELAAKIVTVESAQKNNKREECAEFFNEYRDARGLAEDDIKFEDVGLNITLSTTVKSLKEAIKAEIDRVANDLEVISMSENPAEIMVEYRKTKNLANAMRSVAERHEAIQKAEKKADEIRENAEYVKSIEEQAEIEEELTRPEVVELVTVEDEPLYEVTFTVNGTIEQIKGLKKYLEDYNLDYKQI